MNKDIFDKCTYGMYAVNSYFENKINSQIANSFFQITSEPAIFALSINKNNLTHDFILNSKRVSVSILSEKTPLDFIMNLGFRSLKKFPDKVKKEWGIIQDDYFILKENCVGSILGEIIDSKEFSTHRVFFVKIKDTILFNDEKVLNYLEYKKLKKGMTPDTAPTYISR